MDMAKSWSSSYILSLVRECVAAELQQGTQIPTDEEDLIKAGILDSMGWVGVLCAIEEATGIRNFGNPWPRQQPQCVRELAEQVLKSSSAPAETDANSNGAFVRFDQRKAVKVDGWGHALGSLVLAAAQVESECGLSAETIRKRAGIESVCRASENEDELTLAFQAAQSALDCAKIDPDSIDLIVATSTTFLRLPSLAATLHTRLLLRERCAPFDVGGGCVGLLNALSVAKALLLSGPHRVGLVVASEVNSRKLAHPHVPGEFRGLFGDGACAFVLSRSDGQTHDDRGVAVGQFSFGCTGSFASSLKLDWGEDGELTVQFNGEQLAAGALSQLIRILEQLERRTGKTRSEVDFFAIHEPNPRVVEVFAQRAGVPLTKLPTVSKHTGNLGSATCGVSLCKALDAIDASRSLHSPAIFVAAVGPGLLWGGAYLFK